MRLILASSSPARARMLKDAGLDFETIAPETNEDAVRAELSAEDTSEPEAVARALAAAKALYVAGRHDDALVIGADQVLVLDGEILTKPENVDVAREQLMRLRGRAHALLTAAACAHANRVEWSTLTRADLTMRDFSTAFLDDYLAEMGERVTSTVGGYEIEGPGVQLFSKVDGDLFTIQGLPLVDLLTWLRLQGLISA